MKGVVHHSRHCLQKKKKCKTNKKESLNCGVYDKIQFLALNSYLQSRAVKVSLSGGTEVRDADFFFFTGSHKPNT